MKINFKKTKILPFNLSKKFDFLPQLNFPNCDPLEVIYTTRLLGVTLTSNLTWAGHVDDMCKRATKKLWVLIRFKALGGSQDQMLKVFQTRVRSTLEFAAPVFHSELTKDQSRQIEMKQPSQNSAKSALTEEESISAWTLPWSAASPTSTRQCSPQPQLQSQHAQPQALPWVPVSVFQIFQQPNSFPSPPSEQEPQDQHPAGFTLMMRKMMTSLYATEIRKWWPKPRKNENICSLQTWTHTLLFISVLYCYEWTMSRVSIHVTFLPFK